MPTRNCKAGDISNNFSGQRIRQAQDKLLEFTPHPPVKLSKATFFAWKFNPEIVSGEAYRKSEISTIGMSRNWVRINRTDLTGEGQKIFLPFLLPEDKNQKTKTKRGYGIYRNPLI
jgi:hypothetical protein